MHLQKTIKQAVEFEGVGLHTGKSCQVVVKPGLQNEGIYFVRTDLEKRIKIPALSHYVVDTTLSTTLGKSGVTISTVEHLLSALWGMGIDNAEIDVSGSEVPILDGSSYPFVKKIKRAGIEEQDAIKKILVITKPVSVVDGDRYCYLLSGRLPKVTCSIAFPHPLIGEQKIEFQLDPKSFREKISKARTFGFLKDVENLQKKGLIAGGSLDNAVVLNDTDILNKDGLRFKDEFVRHKVLDTIGDMALLGLTICGHWISHKAGHELHYRLLRKVITQECGYILGLESQAAYNALKVFTPATQPIFS